MELETEYVLLYRNGKSQLCHIWAPSLESLKSDPDYESLNPDQFVSLLEIDGYNVETYEYLDMILE